VRLSDQSSVTIAPDSMRTELNSPFGTTAPQPNTMFEVLAEDFGTGLNGSAIEIEFDSAQIKRYRLSNR